MRQRSPEYKAKQKIWARRWYISHKALCIARAEKWRQANKEKSLACNTRYRLANKERMHALQRAWRQNNPDRVREHWTAYGKRNPHSNVAKRKDIKTATPRWANMFIVREIYDLARRRSNSTGIRWDVDHIVPIHNELVCGLHVEHNLRVIPRYENLKKGNAFEIVDMTFLDRQRLSQQPPEVKK